MSRLDAVITELEQATAQLRRTWDGTEQHWQDSRRRQTEVEFMEPTFELANNTVNTMNTIADQVHRALASLRLP